MGPPFYEDCECSECRMSREEIVGIRIPDDDLLIWKEVLKGGGLSEHDFTDEETDLIMRRRNDRRAREKLEKLRRKKARDLENVFVKCLGRPRGKRMTALRKAIRKFVENLSPEDLEKNFNK